MAGSLIADARKCNYSIAKNKFNSIPKDINTILKEIRLNQFPYLHLSEEKIISVFNNLQNVPVISFNDKDLTANYRNNELCLHFQKHLYHTKCDGGMSPVEAFDNDLIMSEVIENILKKNKPLDNNVLLNEICHHKKVKRTSLFPVRVAKTLISKFGKEKMKILDPCAGYSSRLIGFLSNGYNGTYIGIDPCKKTVHGLTQTYSELCSISKDYFKVCEFINGCAENEMPFMKDEFDIIFTSPPYFDLEKYDTDISQSYLKYPEYEMWLNEFLFAIINESYRLLKKDGVFILNVGNARINKIISDVDQYVKRIFRVEQTILMHSPSKWHESTTEPIFILRKN
jgi:DNA modification methylase